MAEGQPVCAVKENPFLSSSSCNAVCTLISQTAQSGGEVDPGFWTNSCAPVILTRQSTSLRKGIAVIPLKKRPRIKIQVRTYILRCRVCSRFIRNNSFCADIHERR